MTLIRALLADFVDRLSPFWLSLVRTYVPIGLGSIVGWLASRGIDVSQADQLRAESAAMFAGAALWYLVARLLETLGAKYDLPWVVTLGGLMNGIPKPPEYTGAPKVLVTSFEEWVGVAAELGVNVSDLSTDVDIKARLAPWLFDEDAPAPTP